MRREWKGKEVARETRKIELRASSEHGWLADSDRNKRARLVKTVGDQTSILIRTHLVIIPQGLARYSLRTICMSNNWQPNTIHLKSFFTTVKPLGLARLGVCYRVH
jgi:hypothetical protein